MAAPLKVAVVLDYAQFIAPQGDPVYVADLSQTLIQIHDWAANPEVTSVLRGHGAHHGEPCRPQPQPGGDALQRQDPASPCPSADEIRAYVLDLVPDADGVREGVRRHRGTCWPTSWSASPASPSGPSCARALTSGERITGAYLTRMKKELIEKEAAGRLEFLESTRTLDDVAGHDEAKAWLREDAVLLRRGRAMAIPMGYLLTGRIGTGRRTSWSAWPARSASPASR